MGNKWNEVHINVNFLGLPQESVTVCYLNNRNIFSNSPRGWNSKMTVSAKLISSRTPLVGLRWSQVKASFKSLSCVQLFATPWTVALQAPVHEILQARILR